MKTNKREHRCALVFRRWRLQMLHVTARRSMSRLSREPPGSIDKSMIRERERETTWSCSTKKKKAAAAADDGGVKKRNQSIELFLFGSCIHERHQNIEHRGSFRLFPPRVTETAKLLEARPRRELSFDTDDVGDDVDGCCCCDHRRRRKNSFLDFPLKENRRGQRVGAFVIVAVVES